VKPLKFPSRIYVEGIRASGRHGANPGEKDVAQEFVVDLEVIVEVETDSLDSTSDYAAMVALVRSVVSEDSYVLLESLADAISGAIFEASSWALAVTATVHKPGAATALGVDDIAVESIYPPAEDL
jgi:dihydroneopterin aldolase